MHYSSPTFVHLSTGTDLTDPSMDELDKWLAENDFAVGAISSNPGCGQANLDFDFLDVCAPLIEGRENSGIGLSFPSIDQAHAPVAPPSIAFNFDQTHQTVSLASLPQAFSPMPLVPSEPTPAFPPQAHKPMRPAVNQTHQTLAPVSLPYASPPASLQASEPTPALPPFNSIRPLPLQPLSIQLPVTLTSETLGGFVKTKHATVIDSVTTTVTSKKSIHKAPAGVSSATSGLLAQLTGNPISSPSSGSSNGPASLPVNDPSLSPLGQPTPPTATSNQADAGRRSSRAIIPSKRNEQMSKIGSNPGATVVEKENTPPDSPPNWAISAKNFLLVRNLGGDWNSCVEAWLELEGMLGYGTVSGTKVCINIILIIIHI